MILFLCSGNFYRSRFAELLFNHLAAESGLALHADSAGLWPNCWIHNTGPISAHSVAALQRLGVVLPGVHRPPRDVLDAEIRPAWLTIAMKEAEHRPIVAARFPSLLDRVEYWHVHDLEDAPPDEALPLIEANVRELVTRLENVRRI